MESVMNKIRQAREEETKRQADKNIKETVVDGCQVKLHFSSTSDNKIIPAVQSMLITAHLDATLSRGEAA